jgi:antitoxin component YwqK of YwqJK toxin-antitoxin module
MNIEYKSPPKLQMKRGMKHVHIAFAIAIMLFIATDSWSQINQKDRDSLKTGLWVKKDSDNEFKYETYYKKGLKNGLEKVYYRNCQLMALLTYEKGRLVGTGSFFDEVGHLSFTVKYQGVVQTKQGKMIKGYYTIYKHSGEKASEGYGLSESGNEYEMEEIGKWKHY